MISGTLKDTSVRKQFARISSRPATLEELLTTHTQAHVDAVREGSSTSTRLNYSTLLLLSLDEADQADVPDCYSSCVYDCVWGCIRMLLLLLSRPHCWLPDRIKQHRDSAAHEIDAKTGDLVFTSAEDRLHGIRTDKVTGNKFGKFETDIRRDTFYNAESAQAASCAAGGLIEVIEHVVKQTNDDMRTGAAVIRPPGHHSCGRYGDTSGFCIYNNVAYERFLSFRRHQKLC
jgi:acetoin utilization deacetylase AcuC-like enzyme